MVLEKFIRKTLLAITFSSLALIFSCEDNGVFVDCNNCLPDEPLDALVEVKLSSFSSQTLNSTIRVYEGPLENGNLLNVYETYSEEFSFYLPVNKNYTITSSFSYSGNYYVTVDAITPRVKYDKSSCEEPCFYVYDTSVNLKLKYR